MPDLPTRAFTITEITLSVPTVLAATYAVRKTTNLVDWSPINGVSPTIADFTFPMSDEAREFYRFQIDYAAEY